MKEKIIEILKSYLDFEYKDSTKVRIANKEYRELKPYLSDEEPPIHTK